MIERDVPAVASVAQQAVARMLTFVESEQPEETPDFRGYMIDRDAFDRMLAERAADAGADCRYGSSVLNIDNDGAVHTSDGRLLRPRILIGADGPRSRVGAAIGRVNRCLVDTRQVTVPLVLPHDATDIFLSADYRGGYGWLFPKGAVANVGIGVEVGTRQQLKPMLDALLERLTAPAGSVPRHGASLAAPFQSAVDCTRSASLDQRWYCLLAMRQGSLIQSPEPVLHPAVQSGALAGRAAAERLAGRTHALQIRGRAWRYFRRGA